MIHQVEKSERLIIINLSAGEQVSLSRVNQTIQFLSLLIEVKPDISQKTARDYRKLVVQEPKLDDKWLSSVKEIKVIASSSSFLLLALSELAIPSLPGPAEGWNRS